MRFSKVIVAAVVVLNVAFTAVVLWLFLKTGNEPSALIVAWFAFTTGELFSLAWIKRKDGSNENNGNQS